MSRKEARRPSLVQLAMIAQTTTAEGAESLKLTPRQFRRFKARYRAESVSGLGHWRPRRVIPASPGTGLEQPRDEEVREGEPVSTGTPGGIRNAHS